MRGIAPRALPSAKSNEPESRFPNLKSDLSNLKLDRPLERRVREFKYRCAQTFVFGIPVLALQMFGRRLGGPESERWIAILQGLLCGWIVYVAAVGMTVGAVIELRTARHPEPYSAKDLPDGGDVTASQEILRGVPLRMTPVWGVGDLVVGAISIVMCLWSIGAVAPIFVTGHLAYRPTLFHVIVPILLFWTGIRWFGLAKSVPRD
jgi:hypothetical protein